METFFLIIAGILVISEIRDFFYREEEIEKLYEKTVKDVHFNR